MKQNEISELPRLNTENFENIFNVYQDSDGAYFYNLLNTVSFPTDLPLTLFQPYVIKPGDTWPYISYKVFNNPNLWWIILLANNIINPLDPNNIAQGNILKIPKNEIVKEILSQIRR